METKYLTDEKLDYWVAKAEGRKLELRKGEWFVENNHRDWMLELEFFKPSSDWAQGGPIIEREIALITRHGPTRWSALANGSESGHGNTPLVAAMRAYVASKFGDDVPDEEIT